MPKITELYTFIAEDQGPEDEGLVAVMSPDGVWFPMVGADRERVESLRPQVEVIAKQSNKKIHLVKFSVREELEVIKA